MTKYGILSGLVILIAAFYGLSNGVDHVKPKQVQAVSNYQTFVPIAKKGEQFNYVVQRIWRLDACSNHGMLRAYITVRGSNGELLNGIKILRLTSAGDFAGEAWTGDKGPGAAEFSLESSEPYGGNWHLVIEMPEETSQTAWNIRTDLPLWEVCEETGEPGNYLKHISWDVDFVRTR